MTVPTVVVPAARRRRRATGTTGGCSMLWADGRARGGGRRASRCSSSRTRCSCWELVAPRRALRLPAPPSSPRPSRRSCPTCCRQTISPRPTRSTSSCGRSRCGSIGPAAGRCARRASAQALAFAVDAASFGASARRGAGHARATRCGRVDARRRTALRRARGLRFIRRRVWLWGTLCRRGDRLPRLPRPERGAPAVRGQERAARLGRATSASCSRPAASGAIGAAVVDGPARPPAPRRDRHVRDLDARDAGGRGLRHRDRGVAADARLPRLQRARDRGDDRLGDDQAASRAEHRCSAASRASTG